MGINQLWEADITYVRLSEQSSPNLPPAQVAFPQNFKRRTTISPLTE
jgi:hypothetical protein